MKKAILYTQKNFKNAIKKKKITFSVYISKVITLLH